MHSGAEFRGWYLQLANPNPTQKKHAAMGILNQLCAAVFINYADWAERAPKLVPFTMEGATYSALDTGLLIDIDQVEYLRPYDKLEAFLLRPLDDSDMQGRLAYKMVRRRRESRDWVDLRQVSTSTLENLFGHILNKCPKPYIAEQDALRTEVQKYAAQHWAQMP